MNILLIALYNKGMAIEFEEIGLECIAAYLRERGYTVHMLNIRDFEGSNSIQTIKNLNPDIIGFTCYSASKQSIFDTAEALKREMPDISIILGGNLATFNGMDIMEQCPHIDYTIMGEGEYVFEKLLGCIKEPYRKGIESIHGLIYRKDNAICYNEGGIPVEELDALPPPARDLLTQYNKGVALMSSTRGCKGRCSYCSSTVFFQKLRVRSVSKVLDEMESVSRQYNINCFDFIDGSFEDSATAQPRYREIAQGIMDRNMEVYYFVNFRANAYKTLTEADLDLLKSSGLFGVLVGVESNNGQDLKLYRKMSELKDNDKCMSFFLNKDIFVNLGFIMFNPYSTVEGLLENIDFLERYNVACNMQRVKSKLQIYNGTHMFDEAKADGLLVEETMYNCINYRFWNEKLEPLYLYLEHFMLHNNDINFFNFHSVKGRLFLYYAKAMVKRNRDFDAYSLLSEFSVITNQILRQINFYIAKWFRKLVYLANFTWDSQEADRITSEIVSYEILHDLRSQYDLHWKKLLRKLSHQYSHILNMVSNSITYDINK